VTVRQGTGGERNTLHTYSNRHSDDTLTNVKADDTSRTVSNSPEEGKALGVLLTRILAFILTLLMTLSLTGCQPFADIVQRFLSPERPTTSTLSADTSFDELCEQVLIYEVSVDSLTLNQMVADPQARGIEVPRPATLGSIDLTLTQQGNDYYREVLGLLANFAEDELDTDQQLTKKLLTQAIEDTLAREEYFYYDEPLLPSTGIHATLPLSLLEFNFRTGEDIDIYMEALEDIPRFFNEIAAFETEKAQKHLLMSQEAFDDTLSEIQQYTSVEALQGLIDNFNAQLDSNTPPFEQLSMAQKQQYRAQLDITLATTVAPAYAQLHEQMLALAQQSQPLMSLAAYPKGKAYYELEMRAAGFNQDASAAAVVLDDRLDEYWETIVNAPEVLDGADLGQGFTELTQTPENILVFLAERAKADFPRFDTIEYLVKQVPENMPNDYAMAYYLLPPVDNPGHNVIYYLPKNISDKLEFYTTMAHEGIPGHMYQTNAFEQGNPAPLRKLLNYLAYMEGWAMYTQILSLEYLNGDSVATEAYAAYLKFVYGLQARVDIGVNFQNWDKVALQRYLEMWGLEGSAESLYDTAIKQPTAYLPYGLGLMEFFDLRARAEEYLGSTFDAKRFHQCLIDIGPVPFALLEPHLETWLQHEIALAT
jgi:uncharacterized protein (DUF885 family)